MRAYLIVPAGAEPACLAADALVLDGRALPATEPAALRRVAGAARILVRVDGIEAPALDVCLAAAAPLRPDAIVLPARHGRDVAHLGSRLAVTEAEHGLPDRSVGIVALLACAAGVLAAGSFAGASPRLCGLGWDAEAVARALGPGTGPAEAASRPPPRPEGAGGPAEMHGEAATWSPPLAHARAVVRFSAAAAGVEAIEAACPCDDPWRMRAHVASARRDGFAAMLARDPDQARLIRGWA